MGEAAHREPRVSDMIESVGGDIDGWVDHIRGPRQEPFDSCRHVAAVRDNLLHASDSLFVLRTAPPNPALRDESADRRKRGQERFVEIIENANGSVAVPEVRSESGSGKD